MSSAHASPTAGRDKMVAFIRQQLVGPIGGQREELREPPSQRYLMGVLFPQRMDAEEAFEDDVIDESGGEAGEDGGEDPITLANQYMPSSVGLSLLVSTEAEIAATITGARYVEEEKNRWVRSSLSSEDGETVVLRPVSPGEIERHDVFSGAGVLTALWRPFGENWIVTLAIVNTAETPDGHVGVDHEACLCQVGLVCRPSVGRILPYPTADRLPLDEEDEELAFLYRDVPTFAVGHGCATDWEEDEQGGAASVSVEFLPSAVVPDVSFEIPGFERVRRLGFLARIEEQPEVVYAELDQFAKTYRDWIVEAFAQADPPEALRPAALRLRERLETAFKRMDEGISVLRERVDVRSAFALANRAMAMQMRHSSHDLGGSRRPLEDAIELPVVDYLAIDEQAWRPFQLAYLLLTLPSVTRPDHPDRDLVDLIWFPTGGGKTEAYLGVVAIQVLLRRMREGDAGAGTTVITRYTLRLLTTQQFQRSATLTCALELLRRADPARLGTVPISIGIWVGGGTSPNRYSEAVELLADMKAGETTARGFQLEVCPWCGTEIVPKTEVDDGERWGIAAENNDFRMWCPSPRCPFRSDLPVSVVDDALYDRPPTFLIATIDKFAQLAWNERAGVFLGAGGQPGPSLIIQDELHLISGPLGTVAALYEAAFDLVMRRHGARPKVLASTATIRRAGQQVRGLFDRGVFLFPPSGMSADNSYFVSFDRSRPGRQYVGVMAQSHTPTSANVHTSAALLQGAYELDLEDSDRDALWTLVAYHNSLRELGKTVTLMRDDVPARMAIIAPTEERVRRIDPDEDIVELTSNIPSVQIPRNLERLERRRGEPGCPSVVASTNMISVGVDVPRLGLMMIVGQPKTASEYIQASSRIGRSGPGLVVALYSAAKPRDRSHYESFKSYHSALYRQVEPTSVTPYALPARQRALHAALVVVARHALGLGGNDHASAFVADAAVEEAVADLTARVSAADDREWSATEDHLRRLLADWGRRVKLGSATGGLRYRANGKQHVGLLRRFNQPGDEWPTLDSMRNIDVECTIRVRGEDT